VAHPVRNAALIVGAIIVLFWTGYALLETYLLGNPDQKFGAKGGVQFALFISIVSAAIFSAGSGLAYYLCWRNRVPARAVIVSVALLTGCVLATLRNHIIIDTPIIFFGVFGDWGMLLYGFILAFGCGAVAAVGGNAVSRSYGSYT
jgi:hypothetical protein